MQVTKTIKRIGQGGFGNVDHVIADDGGEYACKTFSQNQPLTPDLLQNVLKRFAKEVRIQGAISHPNIVPIVASNLSATPPFYFMPLATSSLDKDIAQDRRLNGHFMSALNDIVAGLEELHSMQIYHRDLKPHNVLRFGSDQAACYAISDFGLISMKETSLSGLTKTGMGKGSDFYTAHEISQDLKAASIQSDVFSLGCILHDMVGTEPRVPFREIREPGEFSAVLLNCTRDDPSRRFSSAKAVLDAILSIGFIPQGTVSAGSVDFLAVLQDESEAPVEFWQKLADFIENSAKAPDIAAICGKMSNDKISELCGKDSKSAKTISLIFSEWVKGTGFGFDQSDAIANRLETFFEKGDYESQVECLLAMLELGTSHNRWFVERKFTRLCDSSMDDGLAKRFVVQMHAVGKSLCAKIAHLERSISFSRSNLHPRVVRALGEICK